MAGGGKKSGGGGGSGGENSKKAAGNARKAEAAAQKEAAARGKQEALEDDKWNRGAKSMAKKDAAEEKKAEAARKKAERDALLAAEERELKTAKTGNAKTAAKKNTGKSNAAASSSSSASAARPGTLGNLDDLDLGLGGDDDNSSGRGTAALSASGIDNALDALKLATTDARTDKVERHPERRYRAAYAAFEARRLPQLEEERPGLRRQQRVELVRREFERSLENPFNQTTASFDASKEEVAAMRLAERRKLEERLSRGGE